MGRRLGLIITLAVVFLLASASLAHAVEPTVISDRADYLPGTSVVLMGDGWAGDSAVRIQVNDTYTQTWSRDVNVPVDPLGGFVDVFTLPSWYVSNYDVIVTGIDTGRVATTAFTDTGGAYSINFTAADPAINNAPYIPTYSKVGPWTAPNQSGYLPGNAGYTGHYSDPLENAVFGHPRDSVESLMPKDMALGQIVPYEIRISVNGSTAPENGVMEFTGYWLTKTTSGGDFGYDPTYKVYGAFVDDADAATADGVTQAKVEAVSSTVVNTGTNNEQIRSTIRVSGLDNGDVIVVEVWVVLKNSIPAKVSGNIQSGLVSARTVSATPETVNTGNQTVPLLQSDDFLNVADIAVAKADEPDLVNVGEDITYTLTVTNTTRAIAGYVIVTDTLPEFTTFKEPVAITDAAGTPLPGRIYSYDSDTRVLTVELGAMSGNQVAKISFSVTAEYGEPMTGVANAADRVNTVTVTTSSQETNLANNTATEQTGVSGFSDLSLVKTDSSQDSLIDLRYSGTGLDDEALYYTLTVENNGIVDASDVTVTDVLDPNETYVAPLLPPTYAPTVSSDGRTLTWTIASIPVGGSVELTFLVDLADGVPTTATSASGGMFDYTVQADPDVAANRLGADLFNYAWVTAGNESSGTLDDNGWFLPTGVTQIPAALPTLSLEKTPTETSYSADGDVIHYTLVAKNESSVATISAVTIADPKLGSLDFGAVTPPIDLGPGETLTATGSYTVSQADVDYGSVYNLATATGSYFGQSISATDDATVPAITAAAIELAKSGVLDLGADGIATPGDLITYAFVATNTGNVTLSAAALTDPLIPDEALEAATIAVGGHVHGSGTYAITQTDIDEGYVDNTARADATGANGEGVFDTAEAGVDIVQSPALSLRKTADPTTYTSAGQTITYTYVLKNTGNVTLHGPFSISDDKTDPDATTGTATDILGPGAEISLSAQYTITDADVTAGEVTNTATGQAFLGDENSPVTSNEAQATINAVGGITVTKYYDANFNGVFDGTDVVIPGWRINVYSTASGALVAQDETEADGSVEFSLPVGEYRVKEIMPDSSWMAIAATTSSGSVLSDEEVVVVVAGGDERVDFFNLCLGAGGGHTPGFWSNKVARDIIQNKMIPAGIDVWGGLSELNLMNGTAFDPKSFRELSSWLTKRNATDMRYQLSGHLAAMWLSTHASAVADGFVDPASAVYAGPNIGFVTVTELMQMADDALADPTATRVYLAELKDALAAGNNNTSFVCPGPCDFSY